MPNKKDLQYLNKMKKNLADTYK